MATDKRFDESISRWLAETAPPRLPERVLDATFERTRSSRQHVGLRGLLGRIRATRSVFALGGAVAVVVVAAVAFDFYADRPGAGGQGPAGDPRSSFLGTWVSTSDADGGTQTMTIEATGDAAVEIVVTDDVASVCSGTPSTMTGTGRLEGSTRLVIAAPVYTCDDGSEPRALSGPPLQEQLRNLTFVLDPRTDVLTVGTGSVWTREVAAAPSPEPTTPPSPPSEAEVTALLNGFLESRVAGEGAQQYLDVPEEDVPLLYATTSGAPYERTEFERVLGIEWPYGWMAFKVRLFAGDTVVEQLLFIGRDGPPWLEYQLDGFGTHIAPTTENGQPLAMPYTYFEGEVTLHAAHPWIFPDPNTYPNPFGRLIPEGPGVPPTTDGGQRHDGWDRLFLIADPALGGAGCHARPDPADAAALAEGIRSDPGLEATAPVAVSVGGAEALMLDVKIAAGTTISVPADEVGDLCRTGILSPVLEQYAVGSSISYANGVATGQARGDWMRLYLFDAPDGLSMRILAIAIIAPESRFERAVEAAAPVVESIEFHAP